jgi:hypothetical protein
MSYDMTDEGKAVDIAAMMLLSLTRTLMWHNSQAINKVAKPIYIIYGYSAVLHLYLSKCLQGQVSLLRFYTAKRI